MFIARAPDPFFHGGLAPAVEALAPAVTSPSPREEEEAACRCGETLGVEEETFGVGALASGEEK